MKFVLLAPLAHIFYLLFLIFGRHLSVGLGDVALLALTFAISVWIPITFRAFTPRDEPEHE